MNLKRTHKRRRTKIKRRMIGGGDFSSARIIGAGGFGIIIHTNDDPNAYKLLYDIEACSELQNEIRIQKACYNLFKNHKSIDAWIPNVTWSSSEPIIFQGVRYLCGIGMTYLPPPLDFTEQVHILLSNTAGDLDSEWGRRIGQPISETNPTRGFFASVNTLEWLWSQEKSTMTIERMAWIMGSAYRIMLNAGIIPIDLEWVWSDGKPWIIDFGMCRFGFVDPLVFLHKHGVEGLADEFYWPHPGERGYEEFMRGFLLKDRI